jgi:cell division protein FtsB
LDFIIKILKNQTLEATMLFKRLRYKIKERFTFVNSTIEALGLASNFLLAIGFMLLIILFLTGNIIDVYQQGKKNFEQILAEKERLEELEEEGESLNEEATYRESKHYIEAYAHENLYLGQSTERLFQVDRDEEQIYELEQIETDPIVLDDYVHWWESIFLW